MRPRVVLKAATSLDGVIDDSSPSRLILSSPEDTAAVDELRAQFDAILVGAETIRKDNPKLRVRSEARVARRVAAGLSAQPLKVTLTRSANLPSRAAFFAAGEARKLVYFVGSASPALDAEIVKLPAEHTIPMLLADLKARGVNSLLVEGGRTLHAQFLDAGLFDQLRIAIAPTLVADPAATYLSSVSSPALALQRVEKLGQMTVLWLVRS